MVGILAIKLRRSYSKPIFNLGLKKRKIKYDSQKSKFNKNFNFFVSNPGQNSESRLARFLHIGHFLTAMFQIPRSRFKELIYWPKIRTRLHRHFLGVISKEHTVKVSKVPKYPKLKFLRKKWKKLTSWGGRPVEKPLFLECRGYLDIWAPSFKSTKFSPTDPIIFSLAYWGIQFGISLRSIA